jgi:hypothetical protein
MKTIVVFKSTSGFTERYAAWIAEELGADLLCAEKADGAILAGYDLVIFGGCLHAVGISGIGLIKRNLDALGARPILVFGVGASPWKEGIIGELEERNFTQDERSKIKLFYLRGGFDFEKLGPLLKLMMIFFRIGLGLKRERTIEEEGMLAAYQRPVDFSRRESIAELVDYAETHCRGGSRRLG